MTIYGVEDRFSIQSQVGLDMCWAAASLAVAGYMGMSDEIGSQQTLANAYPKKKEGNDVKKVLQERCGIESTVLLDWREESESSADDEMVRDLELNLEQHLGNPLLCGLTSVNFTLNSGKSYQHATLIIKYDNVAKVVTIADPAQKNGAILTVELQNLAKGFLYTSKSDMGPGASKRVVSNDENLLMKIYTLVAFRRGTP